MKCRVAMEVSEFAVRSSLFALDYFDTEESSGVIRSVFSA